MCQVKIYGIQANLSEYRDELSDVIHGCVVEAFDYPVEMRMHRFFALGPEDFRFPTDRSNNYTIIEISLFEGRTVAAKKKFYALLYERCQTQIGIEPVDIEIVLTETPRHKWGIRGVPGDELGLDYKVGV
ncbi:MAG TPA: tautomerase family protein [Acidimicrobiales bacterium]